MQSQPKRIPKSKEQLIEEVRTNQKVNHQRELIRKLFAAAPKDMSISDYANHIDVLAGLILQKQKEVTNDMTVASLAVDTKVKDAPNPELIAAVHDIVKDEKAPDEVSALLVKFIDHVKHQVREVAFIERKMSDVGIEEIIK